MEINRSSIAAMASIALGIGAATPLAAQQAAHDSHHANPPQLGNVQFQVDCTPQAQKEFNVAMAYYHSYAWTYITEPIDRALKADPTCGMAHWLRALASLDNAFSWPIPLTPKALAEGEAALERRESRG